MKKIKNGLNRRIDGPTDGRMDGPTDRRTDGRTHPPSYRDARTHLKTKNFFSKYHNYLKKLAASILTKYTTTVSISYPLTENAAIVLYFGTLCIGQLSALFLNYAEVDKTVK